ncbi:MAG: HK97 gp10 family phage protein [Actinomycetia bacterium]|nr:HK97 gp10 family phage protein [Actinomycetes bacterium]
MAAEQRAELPGAVGQVLLDGGHRIQRALERGSPVKTGRLKRSWRTRRLGPVEVEVDNTAPYVDEVDIDRTGASVEAELVARELEAAVTQVLE